MSPGRIRLAVLSGSPPSSRTGPSVVRWFRGEAENFGEFEIDVLDLGADPLPAVITQPPDADAARRLATVSPRLAAAHAFVVVTAEYNHAYPAVLKAAIDWHTAEWQAKPVGFVSYGGRSGGLRAVEQLRLVFSELHTVTIRDSVSFPDVWKQFDEQGEPREPEGCNHAAKVMLEQLLWWARSLGEARDRRPYAA